MGACSLVKYDERMVACTYVDMFDLSRLGLLNWRCGVLITKGILGDEVLHLQVRNRQTRVHVKACPQSPCASDPIRQARSTDATYGIS